MKLLDKDRYIEIIAPTKEIRINNLFALAVVEQKMPGRIYVDKLEEPQTFYVVHPYGMSMLFGNWKNEEFNREFREYALNSNKERHSFVWMQAYPNEWHAVLKDLFGDKLIGSSENTEQIEKGIVELNTRVNFKFNPEKYTAFKAGNPLDGHNIVRTDEKIFNEMKGAVIPANFWPNVTDFVNQGMGFSLYHDGELACTAYSAFIDGKKLELGMETIPKFRGMGFAKYTCSALIDYCLENDFEPVWACRLENTGSFNLAHKLGFELVSELPYYRLGK